MIYWNTNSWRIKAILFCMHMIAAQSISCAYSFSAQDRWEGIRNKTLRVCVQIYMPDYAGEAVSDKTIMDEFMSAGKKRAQLLISSSFQRRDGGVERLHNIRENFDLIVGSGSIVYNSCGEENCMAFIDFKLEKPIRDLIDK